MTESRAIRTPLRSPPVGTRIPGSIHSVTCSLPTMRDVIGYEEKHTSTMDVITSGYPRFVTHFYIRRIAEDFSRRFNLDGRQLFITGSQVIAREALVFAAEPEAGLIEENGLWAVHVPAISPAGVRIKAYMQHVGGGISSRRAEHWLLEHGMIDTPQPEEGVDTDADSAAEAVCQHMGDLFTTSAENVFLSSSGMNAFYAAFRAMNACQQKKGRTDWIQLGWLYVDTIEILRKLSGGQHHILTDVLDLDKLENLLRASGRQIAGIVTEVPTNPLIQTPDLHRLRELADRYELPLIADPTLASPYNIDVLPFCDVAVNSLTKYAASQGDVMMGATVLNPASPWAVELRETMQPWLIPPFSADLRRIAVEIRDYRPVMERINANNMALTAWFQSQPAVEKVFGAYSGESGKNYARLERRSDAPGGLLSIKLRGPVGDFYDRLDLPKGPSFGMSFTIVCPFLYLAHYDLVSTESGRRFLQTHNLDAELLRISIGMEDPDQLISAFSSAL